MVMGIGVRGCMDCWESNLFTGSKVSMELLEGLVGGKKKRLIMTIFPCLVDNCLSMENNLARCKFLVLIFPSENSRLCSTVIWH